MSYANIRKVKESRSDAETNKYLDEGYELIKIISSRTSTAEADEVRPCYVLALRK